MSSVFSAVTSRSSIGRAADAAPAATEAGSMTLVIVGDAWAHLWGQGSLSEGGSRGPRAGLRATRVSHETFCVLFFCEIFALPI